MGVVIARQVTVRRMHGFGARLGAVFVLVLAGALVGCSEGDPEPKMAPTQSVASTPSGSPSDEPTASPSGHVPLSPREEQRAFIDEFFAATTRAMATGDARAFMSLSSPDCESCQTLARNLSSAFAAGGRIEGGSWTVETAAYETRESVGVVWAVSLRTARERWLNAEGEVVKTVKPDLLEIGVALESTPSGWLVRELRLR